MDILKSWFGILPAYKLCRIVHQNGGWVVGHFGIDEISSWLLNAPDGCVIEVIG